MMTQEEVNTLRAATAAVEATTRCDYDPADARGIAQQEALRTIAVVCSAANARAMPKTKETP